MRWLPFSLPKGWPVSLWFFVITAILFLLQWFPYTGVFLMIVGAAFWSILLINLGMAGLIFEAITGRVRILWLLIPALYLGGYYWAYSNDRDMLAVASQETVRFNVGKSLAFDPDRQDLLVQVSEDGLGMSAATLTQSFGLPRAFDSHGRVHMVGTSESCELVRDKPVFLSAGIQAHAITRQGPSRWTRKSTGFCSIFVPGKPDKPTVRITEKATETRHGRLPVTLRDFIARDEASSATAVVRMGRAGPLKRFPMPVMGCALNSAAPSWGCFAGFMRDTVQLLPDMPRYSSGAPIVARMLGLKPSDDLAAHAIGPERFKPMADRADAELAAKELAVLEAILADPLAPLEGDGFMHLRNKPEVLAPYADRMFEALGILQRSDVRGSRSGGELWRLVAVLPEEALAPHRALMAAWMTPGAMRPWTDQTWQIFARLDVADPVQREIMLTKLEDPRGDIATNLLPAFCRMGASAPQDAKNRLLAVWRARGAVAQERGGHRGYDHVQLYLALARMGLKQQAGKIEQRYMGPTFAGIWNEVTPATPADICDLSTHDLSNRYRKL